MCWRIQETCATGIFSSYTNSCFTSLVLTVLTYSYAGESASFLAKSPYIRDLAMLVIGYGMAINIVEVTWKSKLKAAFPDPNSYSKFMGDFSTMTGIATLLMMLGGW